MTVPATDALVVCAESGAAANAYRPAASNMQLIILVPQPIEKFIPNRFQIQFLHHPFFFFGQFQRRNSQQFFFYSSYQIVVGLDMTEAIQKSLIVFIEVRFGLYQDGARQIIKAR